MFHVCDVEILGFGARGSVELADNACLRKSHPVDLSVGETLGIEAIALAYVHVVFVLACLSSEKSRHVVLVAESVAVVELTAHIVIVIVGVAVEHVAALRNVVVKSSATVGRCEFIYHRAHHV